jgi:hypothetical protein
MQLMEFCKRVFELEGLDIYLRPYQIVRYITCHFADAAMEWCFLLKCSVIRLCDATFIGQRPLWLDYPRSCLPRATCAPL